MYFLRGSLPWQGLKAATNKQKYEKIGEKKQTTGIRALCEGFPSNLFYKINYSKRIKILITCKNLFIRSICKIYAVFSQAWIRRNT